MFLLPPKGLVSLFYKGTM